MKRIILYAALPVMWMLTVSATVEPVDKESVGVTGTEIVRTGNSVNISFSLHVGEKVTRKDLSLVIGPVLRNSGGEASLAPIVVRGANAKVSDGETEVMKTVLNANGTPYYTANGSTVEYAVSIPWQSWMQGSELVFNGINVGKKRSTEVTIGTVAGNLLREAAVISRDTPEPAANPQSPTEPARIPDPAQVGEQPRTAYQTPGTVRDRGTAVQKPAEPAVRDYSPHTGYDGTSAPQTASGSAGDELASRFTFVEPVANFNKARQAATSDELFDYNMPLIFGSGAAQTQNGMERFIEITREGAACIRFNAGSRSIGRDLGENNRMLVDLISSIRMLKSSPDVRIAQVVIVGFSSPEGTFEKNEELAKERASAIRDFLTANSYITPELISIYNGSVGWTILRSLVAGSNMSEKYKILDIIDNTPAWDTSRNRGRLGKLMSLNGGDEYRYMREHFFPQLRQTGAYIKVYYENIHRKVTDKP